MLSQKIKGLDIPQEVSELIHELQVHQIELEMQNEELRKSQLNLQNSQNRYFDLYNFAPTSYFTLDKNELIKDVNIAGTALLGVEEKNLINSAFIRFVAHDSRYKFSKLLKIFKDKGIDKKCELNLLKDKKDISVILEINSIPGSDGSFKSLLITAVDITEIKKAEKALKESQQSFKTAVDFTYDWEYWIGPDGNFIYVSPSCERITGYRPDEFLENPDLLMKIIHPDDREKFGKHLVVETKKEGYLDVIHFRIINKQGEERWIGHGCQLVHNDEGVFLGIRASNRDITKRKQDEETIKEQYYFLQNLINMIPYPVFYKDVNYLYRSCNKAFEEFLGVSKEKIIGKTVYELAPQDLADMYHQKDKELMEGEGSQVYEAQVRYADGSRHIVLFNKNTFNDHKGNLAGLIGVMIDITDLKHAEMEMKKSIKEKENLLTEIHHRVKNNMQIISSLLNLQIQHVHGVETETVLKESQGRVKTMAMIHEKLYLSSSLTNINIREYIQQLVYDILFSYGIKKGTIQLEFDIEDININMETAIPCGLIINELVTNSVKYAFPQNEGTIKIELKSWDNQLKLFVADNGIGFPGKIDIEKTETLGLQLVNSLVGQLEGDIELDKSNGTEFTITFKELDYKNRL